MRKLKKIVVFIVVLSILIPILTFLTPIFKTNAQTLPEITAKSAYLINLDSDVVLYEKNADEKVYPASTTKIMTALLILEHEKDLTKKVTVSKNDYEDLVIGSSTAGLDDGEELTIDQLLHCILIASANEACNTAARFVSGSREDFIKLMNKRAKELGCKNTSFSNTHGLHDDQHYTTAADMYNIAKKALEFPEFRKICKTESFTLPPKKAGEKERIYRTTNNLLVKNRGEKTYYKYATGVKTGHTSKAGRCIVALADNGKAEYLALIFNDIVENSVNNAFVSAKTLFEWAYSNYSLKSIIKAGEPIEEIDVKLAKGNDYLSLSLADDFSIPVKDSEDIAKVQKSFKIKENVTAPVKKGQVLGSVTFSLDNKVIGERELVATSDVERSTFLYYIDKIKSFFKNPIVIIITVILVLLIIIYIVYVLLFLNRKKRYKKVRRRRF